MCITYIKANKTVENSDYTIVWITVNDQWKKVTYNFCYFHFSNINMSLVKIIIKKLLLLR